tara:strand:+ start:123 stop:515 length:393 start_codon:yes stop_codon:yes gene_type:complete
MKFEFLGLILFLGSIFLSRSINKKANRRLDQEKKAQLIDLFSNNSKRYIILLIIVVLTIIGFNTNIMNPFVISLGFFSFLIYLFIFNILRVTKKLMENNFPTEYIKEVKKASFIRLFGISAMLLFLVFRL